jgi:hypothetical protein
MGQVETNLPAGGDHRPQRSVMAARIHLQPRKLSQHLRAPGPIVPRLRNSSDDPQGGDQREPRQREPKASLRARTPPLGLGHLVKSASLLAFPARKRGLTLCDVGPLKVGHDNAIIPIGVEPGARGGDAADLDACAEGRKRQSTSER